jgi:flavodoxin
LKRSDSGYEIGIIVYSKTGNTRAVAEKLKDALAQNGNDVTMRK